VRIGARVAAVLFRLHISSHQNCQDLAASVAKVTHRQAADVAVRVSSSCPPPPPPLPPPSSSSSSSPSSSMIGSVAGVRTNIGFWPMSWRTRGGHTFHLENF